MLRYRLRTLLIATMIAGVVLARIAYLKQQAKSHRRAVENAVVNLVPQERGSHDEIRSSIQFLASAGTPLTAKVVPISGRTQFPREITILENGKGYSMVVQNVASTSDWRTAVHHQIIAERYDRAVWRPWTVVSESLP